MRRIETSPWACVTDRRTARRAAYGWITSALFVALTTVAQTGSAQPSAEQAEELPVREIRLSSLGYQPPEREHFSDKEIARNPNLLLRDTTSRVVFINDGIVAVYFSRPIDAAKEPSQFPEILEAFFIDVHAGTLIAHKTWPTRYRRWFNDSSDTEGRIMSLENGFLVHAGDALHLYSYDFHLKRDLGLAARFEWSVRIAPLGRTIEALPINGSESEAKWLDFETLDTIRTSHEFPGIQSISENGSVVSRLAHCLDLRQAGGAGQHLCCNDDCSRGMPISLSDTNILVYYRGFEVLSTKGEVLWNRKADVKFRNESMGNAERSLTGNRFAFWLNGWSQSSTFDGARIRKNTRTILVYDSSRRVKIFEASIKNSDSEFTFALSPNGDSLGLLAGEALYVYALPK